MAVIVIAEDDPHILRVVSLWLKQNRHTLFEAANGQKALDLVRNHQPDLLITDMNMPVMDGVELTRTCAAEHLPKVGTIMLTSRCDQGHLQSCLKGLNVVLHPKPFSPSRLMEEVQRLWSEYEQCAPVAQGECQVDGITYNS
jgi:CheY-like chemotaxis protein